MSLHAHSYYYVHTTYSGARGGVKLLRYRCLCCGAWKTVPAWSFEQTMKIITEISMKYIRRIWETPDPIYSRLTQGRTP